MTQQIKKTFSVATLGCKTNQFESVAIEERLAAAGFEKIPFEEGADLVIVNTCTVTAATDSQSRNLIRRARRHNVDCRVIVTGCYAQVEPELIRNIPGVSVVLGNDEKKDILRYLETGADETTVSVSDIQSAQNAVPHEINSFAERSRAFVQIQNGCNAYCSYCIIPYARGRSRSAEPGQVVSQVKSLAAGGFNEIVLTGIHIGAYGVDLDPVTSLEELLYELHTVTGVNRLRLGSIEPNELPDSFLKLVGTADIICPHLHIPLQSGDNSVLERMNRHYRTDDFYGMIMRAVELIPDVAIGLDVITGFPGETDEEFANTYRLIESLPVSYLHVFPFSKRAGTPAAKMPDQVPGDVAKERAARLRFLSDGKQQSFARRFVGRELEVVVEGGGKSSGKGLSRHYLSVRFNEGEYPAGSLIQVAVSGWEDGALVGEVV